jgi:hypothetical protein
MSTSEGLPNWRDHLATLADADHVIGMLAQPVDSGLRQEVGRLLFQSLAGGVLSVFLDPLQPDFVPLASSALPYVGTNPDFIYAYARIDGRRAYRLSGTRGDGLFLLLDFAAGGLGAMDELGPSVGTLDIDDLTLDAERGFDVLISPERPMGHAGDWFKLDIRATTITVRQAAYDWGKGNGARIAIECSDQPIAPRRLDAEEISARLGRLALHPARVAGFALNYVKGQRDRGFVNRLEHDDWAGRGGFEGQHYFQGLFRLEPSHALILDTDIPERVRYWNVQLNDPLWNTIDWVNRQSSLNGGQARIDSDGRFRAVISMEDPGVPNWLDPGGYADGTLMLRWMQSSSAPQPSLRSVALPELRRYLPDDTPSVAPEARQKQLRERRRSAQWRRRW